MGAPTGVDIEALRAENGLEIKIGRTAVVPSTAAISLVNRREAIHRAQGGFRLLR